jgi:hypothetical protein
MAVGVAVESDRLRIGETCFVAFQRTLRIPDDGRTYPLPPGLGRLPVREPKQKESVARPAFVVPLRRREAVWLAFDVPAWRPHAILIGLGNVNAVTGQAWSDRLGRNPQNYVVAPPQLWLDGVKVAQDRVRQFVATPLGTGTTIESQLSKRDEEGTVKIVVFEPHDGRFPDGRPPAGPTASRLRAPGGMGLGAGGEVRQRVYADPHGIDVWNAEARTNAEVRLVTAAEFEALTGEQPPPTPVDAQTYTAHGFPWFELYDDAAADLPATVEMEGVRSVDRLSGGDSRDPSIDVPGSQITRLGPQRGS